MIEFTPRLDEAMMRSAWAHEQAGQHRKNSEIPYIAHPYAVMFISSQFTDKEDILIASLLHDVVEDVSPEIYSADDIRRDFGSWVCRLVLDVTKDIEEFDWHRQSNLYLHHLGNKAVGDALIVALSDKIHGVKTATSEYEKIGDSIWQDKFGGKTAKDKLWVYDSVLEIGRIRQVNVEQTDLLGDSIATFRRKLKEGGSLDNDVAV